jgi:hypothetical protein
MGSVSDRKLVRQYRAVDKAAEGDDPDGRAARLEEIAAEIVRRHPDAGAYWYDRGMFAKWRRDWPASVEHNRVALELIPERRRQEEPAAWNLGIAATALRDWATARRAWQAFGLELPGSGGEPIETDFGVAPVRLNPGPRFVGERPPVIDGEVRETEVVWGRRLCPSRIRILNVPTPQSGHRCGDVVLHDGDTLGTRRLGQEELGVFNEIELWERSPVPTLTATLTMPASADLEELDQLLTGQEVPIEDWTVNLQLLCRACSEGSPGQAHDHPVADGSGARSVGISGGLAEVGPLLRAWQDAGPGRSVEDLRVALA